MPPVPLVVRRLLPTPQILNRSPYYQQQLHHAQIIAESEHLNEYFHGPFRCNAFCFQVSIRVRSGLFTLILSNLNAFVLLPLFFLCLRWLMALQISVISVRDMTGYFLFGAARHVTAVYAGRLRTRKRKQTNLGASSCTKSSWLRFQFTAKWSHVFTDILLAQFNFLLLRQRKVIIRKYLYS